MSTKINNSVEFDNLVRNNKGVCVVDFYADWCGPCKMLSPIMEEVSNSYTVYKLNVDENMELAEEFNVFSIPCVIKYQDGKQVDRFTGFRSKEEVLEFLK